MSTGLPTKEEQRQMILQSDLYKSGEHFNRIDGAKICGLTIEQTADLLTGMAVDGLLRKKRLEQKQGASKKGSMIYSRPPSRFLSMPLRKKTDSEIGCASYGG